MPDKRDTRRRFEQWAHNPACQANTLSAVHGISMADVAKREGLHPSMGQSPFAIARGQLFERALYRDDASGLREELERAGILPTGSRGLADFRLKMHGGPMLDLDAAREATTELLRRLGGAATRDRPTIVSSATLLIPSGVMLPEALLVVDVIAVRYDGSAVTLSVGEIKTYPDRGGHTDTSELASARAQAGVYVHALRMVATEFGLAQRLTVADRGFLVLSRPGFNRPSVRAGEDLKFQAWRAERGFDQLEAAAEALPPGVIDGTEKRRLDAVREAPKVFCDACVTFCDLAPACYERALELGNAAALGDDIERFLGEVPLERAMKLMDGSRAKNPAEEDLKRRLMPQS